MRTMRTPYFQTIKEYVIKRKEQIREDDKVLVQSNGDYLRIAISDPSMCRQIAIIEIPIEELLK